jgi:hypothetical protein
MFNGDQMVGRQRPAHQFNVAYGLIGYWCELIVLCTQILGYGNFFGKNFSV